MRFRIAHTSAALALLAALGGCVDAVHLSILRYDRGLGPTPGFFGLKAVSPSGARVALEGDDRVITVWDLRTGKALSSFPSEYPTNIGNRLNQSQLVFSPDGERVARVGWDGRARVWSAETGRLELVLTHATAGTFISPGGYTVPYREPPPVNSVAFSPSGDLIATTAMDGWVRLWNARTGARVRSIGVVRPDGRHSSLQEGTFSPDGRYYVVAGYNNPVVALNVETGATVASFPNDYTGLLAFDDSGTRLLTNSMSGTHVFSFPDGKVLLKAPPSRGGVAISPDGRLVASMSVDGVVLRSVDSGREMARMSVFRPHIQGMGLAFTARGELAVINGVERRVSIWRVNSWEHWRDSD